MSEEKKDKELKKLSKERLNQQIQIATDFINQANAKINELQIQAHQNVGIINYCRHLISEFDLPEKVETPKLEVK